MTCPVSRICNGCHVTGIQNLSTCSRNPCERSLSEKTRITCRSRITRISSRSCITRITCSSHISCITRIAGRSCSSANTCITCFSCSSLLTSITCFSCCTSVTSITSSSCSSANTCITCFSCCTGVSSITRCSCITRSTNRASRASINKGQNNRQIRSKSSGTRASRCCRGHRNLNITTWINGGRSTHRPCLVVRCACVILNNKYISRLQKSQENTDIRSTLNVMADIDFRSAQLVCIIPQEVALIRGARIVICVGLIRVIRG